MTAPIVAQYEPRRPLTFSDPVMEARSEMIREFLRFRGRASGGQLWERLAELGGRS